MKNPERENSKEDKVMAALQEVRSEIATLKESVEKNRANEEQLTSTPLGSHESTMVSTTLGLYQLSSKR